jgi:hypothetical protein
MMTHMTEFRWLESGHRLTTFGKNTMKDDQIDHLAKH